LDFGGVYEVNQRVPGNKNHVRLPLPQRWFSLAYVGLYSNGQLLHTLLLFTETEAVTAVSNFVDTPKQKINYSKGCMDNKIWTWKSFREAVKFIHSAANESAKPFVQFKKNTETRSSICS
jgi:hypothetical protein